MHTVSRYAFLLLVILPGLLSAQTRSIELPVIGVDGQPMIYGEDYEVTLIADGKQLVWSAYEIMLSETNGLQINLPAGHSMSALRLVIQGPDYKVYSRNCFVGKAAKRTLKLSPAHPVARPVMVSTLRYYRTFNERGGMINFEVVFRNNLGKEVLLEHLRVDAAIEQACATPDPTFAKITFDNEVKFYTQLDTNNVVGMSSESSDHLGHITGSVDYEACGERSVDLQMPLATIVPASKFSKMVIQLPDDLRFYEHRTINTSSEGVPIDYKVRYAKQDQVENVMSVFQDIPDVVFTFTAVADEKWQLKAAINPIGI